MKPTQLLGQNIRDSIRAKETLLGDKHAMATFERAIDHVIDCYRKGGRLYNRRQRRVRRRRPISGSGICQ